MFVDDGSEIELKHCLVVKLMDLNLCSPPQWTRIAQL
jgi:hypothetical protein